jgi:putative hydrolase
MADENKDRDEFQEFLKKFFSSSENFNPEDLANQAGLPIDPANLGMIMDQLQKAVSGQGGGINWKLVETQARKEISSQKVELSQQLEQSFKQAFNTASLWLDEVTTVGQYEYNPLMLTRQGWVIESLGLFKEIAEPVATKLAEALAENLQENLPEELSQLAGPASSILKSAGGSLFAMQFGQSLGQLANQSLSGGEIGIPISDRPSLCVKNIEEFAEGLGLDSQEVLIYLAVRELALQRLFTQSGWLKDRVVNQILEYSKEISIDTEKINRLADSIDITNPTEIQNAISSGAFINEPTESQRVALDRIRVNLALIEGWVDTITEKATERLPSRNNLAEAIRRRRVSDNPSQKLFGTLIGLELQPKMLRECSELFKQLELKLSAEQRDELWLHPDQLPTEEEIADPEKLIARLSNGKDDLDAELRGLLGE